MATAYRTPGVYIEEIPKFPPSIAPVETAIPAFIGYTRFATDATDGDLRNIPTRISSLVEYEHYFGGPQEEVNFTVTITETTSGGTTTSIKALASLTDANRSRHNMYYSLQMFFANGGGPCWIVSVGDYKPFATGVPGDVVESELEGGLDALVNIDEPTLIVFPESQWLSITDYNTLHTAAITQCSELQDRFTIMDLHGGAVSMNDSSANLLTAVSNFRTNGIGTNDLKYAAVYAPNIETTLDMAYDETSVNVTHSLSANGTTPVITSPVQMSTIAGTNNGRYEMCRAAIRDFSCVLPPCGAIAGIYANVDEERGVWKAPANVSLAAVIKPTIAFSNVEQDQMNVDPTAGKSVNAIRSFTGKGTLVWGARTLAGNDNEWRYVNVRRFFIFVEESVKKATEQFVFEPNDANTWVRVQAMIENFLTTLWRQGALQGIKPEHAFYVAVGLGKTMTALDILEGRIIIEIGMAAVRPAEFIILRFSHKMAES